MSDPFEDQAVFSLGARYLNKRSGPCSSLTEVPLLWISTWEAQTAGTVSLHRKQLRDPLDGILFRMLRGAVTIQDVSSRHHTLEIVDLLRLAASGSRIQGRQTMVTRDP